MNRRKERKTIYLHVPNGCIYPVTAYEAYKYMNDNGYEIFRIRCETNGLEHYYIQIKEEGKQN